MDKDFCKVAKYRIYFLEDEKAAFNFFSLAFFCAMIWKWNPEIPLKFMYPIFLKIVSFWHENVNNENKSIIGFVFWSLFEGVFLFSFTVTFLRTREIMLPLI